MLSEKDLKVMAVAVAKYRQSYGNRVDVFFGEIQREIVGGTDADAVVLFARHLAELAGLMAGIVNGAQIIETPPLGSPPPTAAQMQ